MSYLINEALLRLIKPLIALLLGLLLYWVSRASWVSRARPPGPGLLDLAGVLIQLVETGVI